jgi:hypothetical protein
MLTKADVAAIKADQNGSRARKLYLGIVLTTISLVALREALSGRTVLASPAPFLVYIAAATVAIFILILIFLSMFRISKVIGSKRKLLVLILVSVPMLLLGCTYLARWFFELAAFAGRDRAAVIVEAPILYTSLRSRSLFPRVYVKPTPNGRTIDVRITRETWERLRSNGSATGSCIKLTLETGRWEAVRAVVPALWDNGMSKLRRCR